MEDALKNLFSQPIVIGICIGLVIALLVWIRAGIKALSQKSDAAARRDKLKDEIANLQKHLHTQMEINTKGNESLKQALATQKETNQNLTQAISVLKDKPGRAEIRTLHLYSKALSIMNTRAPGFGSAWETRRVRYHRLDQKTVSTKQIDLRRSDRRLEKVNVASELSQAC
jgi:hypothetical protein